MEPKTKASFLIHAGHNRSALQEQENTGSSHYKPADTTAILGDVSSLLLLSVVLFGVALAFKIFAGKFEE
jgi:hypothetical protein